MVLIIWLNENVGIFSIAGGEGEKRRAASDRRGFRGRPPALSVADTVEDYITPYRSIIRRSEKHIHCHCSDYTYS